MSESHQTHPIDADSAARLADDGLRFELLTPEQDAVATRSDAGIAQRPVVVVDVPAVQLEDQPPAGIDEPLVLGSAVVAAHAEEALEPGARRLDVVDREEWLRAHRADRSDRYAARAVRTSRPFPLRRP